MKLCLSVALQKIEAISSETSLLDDGLNTFEHLPPCKIHTCQHNVFPTQLLQVELGFLFALYMDYTLCYIRYLLTQLQCQQGPQQEPQDHRQEFQQEFQQESRQEAQK
jgi:hypothetical protein